MTDKEIAEHHSALYLFFKEALRDHEAQLACLEVLEHEYGWEGR